MAPRIKKVLKYSLSLVLAGALLYFAFRGIDWSEFMEGLRSTRWGWILASVGAGYMALVFRAERWLLQLKAVDAGAGRISVWHASNYGNFMNIVVPGVGEFVRCAKVSGRKSASDRVFGTIIVERAVDVLSILLLFLLAVVLSSGTLVPFVEEHILAPISTRLSLTWVLLGATVLLGAVLLAAFKLRGRSRVFGKIADIVEGVFDGVKAFGRIRHKGLFILYTIGIWTMYVLVTYFTFRAVPGLDSGMGLVDALFVSAVGNFASVVPTPGNLGAYHYLVGIALSSIYFGAGSILPIPLLFATLSHGIHAALLILLAVYSFVVEFVKSRMQ